MEGHLDLVRMATIRGLRRVVVKVGSAVLAGDGRLRPSSISKLATDITAVRHQGVQVVLVSSGAVASGFSRLGLEHPPKRIDEKQAAAAIGQPRLMRAYARAFDKRQVEVAQVLLTAADLDHRLRFLNARHTLAVLLERGVLPIINENDSVSFEEIKIGDNDRLSALVANVVSADLLLLLTNVDGVYESMATRKVVAVVPSDRSPFEYVDAGKSRVGTGGMLTKMQAAKLAGDWGIPTVVASGKRRQVIQRIIAGEALGTFFVPRPAKGTARKRWIAFATKVAGTIVVDNGAREALVVRHKSLLPSGILKVVGEFPRGSQVAIGDSQGEIVGRGLTGYSSDEIDQIKGQKSSQIQTILGYSYGPEVVHCDDLALNATAVRTVGQSV